MLKLFCDDFIHMEKTSDLAQLLNLSRTLLHGIHSVFPPTPMVVRKEVLGWMVYGATHCIELA